MDFEEGTSEAGGSAPTSTGEKESTHDPLSITRAATSSARKRTSLSPCSLACSLIVPGWPHRCSRRRMRCERAQRTRGQDEASQPGHCLNCYDAPSMAACVLVDVFRFVRSEVKKARKPVGRGQSCSRGELEARGRGRCTSDDDLTSPANVKDRQCSLYNCSLHRSGIAVFHTSRWLAFGWLPVFPTFDKARGKSAFVTMPFSHDIDEQGSELSSSVSISSWVASCCPD